MVRSKLAQCAVVALAATTLTASPADAVTGYTPEGVCGSGFGRVKDGTRAAVDDHGTVSTSVRLLSKQPVPWCCEQSPVRRHAAGGAASGFLAHTQLP